MRYWQSGAIYVPREPNLSDALILPDKWSRSWQFEEDNNSKFVGYRVSDMGCVLASGAFYVSRNLDLGDAIFLKWDTVLALVFQSSAFKKGQQSVLFPYPGCSLIITKC